MRFIVWLIHDSLVAEFHWLKLINGIFTMEHTDLTKNKNDDTAGI
jgi:hypothetical protein